MIRRRCPDGFVLTEWIRQRYGLCAGLAITACTVLNLFLFMVSELSAIKSCVESLADVPGLPVLIVEAVIVSLYTALGGFYVAFFTDNIQVATFLILFIVCIISVGCTAHIDKSSVGPSELLQANVLSWKLLYILPVAIITNDCFMAGFWLRTFASKTDKDLYISCGLTAFLLFAICAVVGIPGMLAVWMHLIDPSDPDFDEDGAVVSLYKVIHHLPSWLSGFVLVFVTVLSCCTFDSLQSAMVSTISNDLFRNQVRLSWIRLFVLALMAPCIVVALKAVNVLNIYLIVDVLSSCVVPVLFLGLNERFFYWISGVEIICTIIGGIITVFVYGTIYYGSASQGGGLLLMEDGLYLDDWGPFGAFVAAPVGSLIGGFVGLVLHGIYEAIRQRQLFAVFNRPSPGSQPADLKWFDFDKPWYEVFKLGPWARTVDYWLFNQEDSRDDSSQQEALEDPYAVGASSKDDRPSAEVSNETRDVEDVDNKGFRLRLD